jgi:hypothetical protein
LRNKKSLSILDQQYVNEWEIDFCINFLSDLHGEEEEFIDNESKENNIYEHVQEYYQQNIISSFSLNEQNQNSIEHNHIFSFEIDEDIQASCRSF